MIETLESLLNNTVTRGASFTVTEIDQDSVTVELHSDPRTTPVAPGTYRLLKREDAYVSEDLAVGLFRAQSETGDVWLLQRCGVPGLVMGTPKPQLFALD